MLISYNFFMNHILVENFLNVCIILLLFNKNLKHLLLKLFRFRIIVIDFIKMLLNTMCKCHFKTKFLHSRCFCVTVSFHKSLQKNVHYKLRFYCFCKLYLHSKLTSMDCYIYYKTFFFNRPV